MKAEWSAQTDQGNFRYSAEMDCTAPYYYHRSSVTDFTEKGVAAETREQLGAPKAHQETEYLFVDGKSFARSSGAWASDTPHDWAATPSNYNPRSECQPLQEGKDPEDGPFVPDVHFIPILDYARILSENKIEYVAERTLENGQCREYRVVYQDSVETSRRATPNGTDSSYDLRPVQATFCLGTKDRLPRQAVQGPWTVKFSYDDFEKLAAPSVGTAQ